MIYVNAVGYRDIALPIVIVATKFFAVPIRQYDINTIKEEERASILDDSIYKSKEAILHPDQIEIESKQRKIASLVEYAATMVSYETGDRNIVLCSNLPKINPLNMSISTEQEGLELDLTLWHAERVRHRYVVMADVAKPAFEFRSNKGEPTRRHYKVLFQRGPTRVHHSISPYGLAKYILDLARKKDYDLAHFYKYIRKTPKWWFDYSDTPLRDFYSEKELAEINEVKLKIDRTSCREKSVKDPYAYKLLKPKGKFTPYPEEFQEWLQENEPEDLDSIFI